jgi:carbonic anhydrase
MLDALRMRLHPRLALFLAAAFFASCAVHKSEVRTGGHWGYEGNVDPSHWCDLDPANSACCTGKEQSPIDILTARATPSSVPKLELDYPSTTFSVVNNGHTVQANLEVGKDHCGLKLGGTAYDLVQFHMHAPSEHSIDGRHSPVEIHLVHKSADGALAVVGLLVDSGPANGELEKVWRLAPAEEGNGGVAVGVNLARVLPASHANYRYSGSLTTPPCSEHVQWIVMQGKITMSDEQLAKLEAMFSGDEFPEGNRRPVQPIGGRTVALDSGN